MAAAREQANAHPAIREHPGLTAAEGLFVDGGHGNLREVLDLDAGTVGIGEIESPDVLGIHVGTETGRQHGAVGQYKTVGCMNVGNLEVNVVHGADGGAVERSGVDHQLDDVVALAGKHEFHQAQVSGRWLVTPELRATDGVAIEVEDGLQLFALDDDADVLQM